MQDNLIVFPEPSPSDKAQLVTHALPVSLTKLVGREHEVQAIHALLLRPDVRILTLTGTAGVGKTCLALQAATEMGDAFIDGICFVPLAAIRDPELVMPAIARQLGVQEMSVLSIFEQVKVALQEKRLLLVLDNFEQVVTAALQLEELLVICSSLKVIVTSRAVLHLQVEQVFSVLPLSLPDLNQFYESEALRQFAAVTLFIQRAQAMLPTFVMTPTNARLIAEICVRLDGLPLAIELAAARIRLLPPHALLARLSQRLQLLTRGAQDRPLRQQTLRNTLQWSYDLLSVDEQRLFQRLSVFVGGFALEASETVGQLSDERKPEAVSMLDSIESLLDKSLLLQIGQEGEESRLTMLETIREYGLERLQESGETHICQRAHVLHYLAFAEEAETHLKGEQQVLWWKSLEREQGNLRAALTWLIEQEEGELALHLCGTLWWFWSIRGYWSEGWGWMETTLHLPQAQARTTGRARTLYGAAVLTYYLGYPEAGSLSLLEESVSISRELEDKRDLAASLSTLGWALSLSTPQGVIIGRRDLEESLALAREVGDPWILAFALQQMGNVLHYQGDLKNASRFLEECVQLYREVKDTHTLSDRLLELTQVAVSEGYVTQAMALAQESLFLARELKNKPNITRALYSSAMVQSMLGNIEQAVVLCEESLLLARERGDKIYTGLTLLTLGALVMHQGKLQAAKTYAQESLTLLRSNKSRTSVALSLLGDITRLQGDLVQARAACKEGAMLAEDLGYRYGLGKNLIGLARVAVDERHPKEAARLFAAAENWLSLKVDLLPFERADYERAVKSGQTQLSEEAWTAAWVEGRTMTLERLLVDQRPMPQSPPLILPPINASSLPPLHAGLTLREMDVLRLLAQGLTSAQIAKQLVIGLVTVNSHVRSIYSKLGVTSRAAATRYALEHQLL